LLLRSTSNRLLLRACCKICTIWWLLVLWLYGKP